MRTKTKIDDGIKSCLTTSDNLRHESYDDIHEATTSDDLKKTPILNVLVLCEELTKNGYQPTIISGEIDVAGVYMQDRSRVPRVDSHYWVKVESDDGTEVVIDMYPHPNATIDDFYISTETPDEYIQLNEMYYSKGVKIDDLQAMCFDEKMESPEMEIAK